MRDLSDPLEMEIFKDCFEREIESWHTSSLCCCQFCYKDYCEEYPKAYKRLITIDVDSFRQQTRLFSYYEENEYKILVKNLECPNCLKTFEKEVYAFELPFTPSPEFYINSSEISKIGRQTPFLIYSHPFAQKVFNEIERLFKENASTKIEKLYRGRIIKNQEVTKTDFLFPPADKTSEGRYNHSGIPVLYLASGKTTCYYECRSPKENFHIAEFEFNQELNLLDLIPFVEEREGIIQDLIWSSLLSAPKINEGWENPQYIFSRFVADCANHIGFHGIKYPSVEFSDGENIVLFNNKDLTFNLTEFSKFEFNANEK